MAVASDSRADETSSRLRRKHPSDDVPCAGCHHLVGDLPKDLIGQIGEQIVQDRLVLGHPSCILRVWCGRLLVISLRWKERIWGLR